MKYINYGGHNIVIFSEHLSHHEVHNALGSIIRKAPKHAGFFVIRGNEVICFGESISLNKRPNLDTDAVMIRKILETTYQDVR